MNRVWYSRYKKVHPEEVMFLKLCVEEFITFFCNTFFNSDLLLLEIYMAASNSPSVTWVSEGHFCS